MSTPFEDDVTAYARAGFDAVEIWLTKLETYLESHTIAEAKALLDGEGLRPLAAASQGGLMLSEGAERAAHLDHFKRRLDWLAALGVPTLVVPSDGGSSPSLDDYPRAVAGLAEAAEIAAKAGVRLALEFRRGGGCCAGLETAAGIVGEVGESLGICLDLFHYYTGPSKFEDLAGLPPGALAWVQLSDLSGTPREVAGDSDRIIPGEGDFQIGPILDQVAAKGYRGGVSLEVLNPAFWSIPADMMANLAAQALSRLFERPASGVA